MLQVDYSMVGPQPAAQLADAGVDRIDAPRRRPAGPGHASALGTDIHSHDAGQVQPEGRLWRAPTDRAPEGLGFSTLMAASAGTIAFMFVMGAPSTRIWPPEMGFGLWLLELFAHQRDEQAARAQRSSGNSSGSFWLKDTN